MATTDKATPAQTAKTDDASKQDAVSRPEEQSAADRAKDHLKYRGDQVGAAQAVADAEKAEAAKPVTASQFVPTYMNQVPQEGALVETPPQPTPPPFTEAELREMDHAPLGLREPSVAQAASGPADYDQTVHPASRVNDPTKPL